MTVYSAENEDPAVTSTGDTWKLENWFVDRQQQHLQQWGEVRNICVKSFSKLATC